MYSDETDRSFKKFYLDNFHKVKNFANVYLNDEFMSENIAQDIFIKIYEARGRLKTDDSLLPYLYSATRNRCMNELRRRKMLRSYSEDAEYRFKVDLASESLDAQNLSENDINLVNETYWKTLNALPKATRETFLLHRDGGLKYQDIAKVSGVSIKTIEYRISFALKRLRMALGGLFEFFLFSILWYLAS